MGARTLIERQRGQLQFVIPNGGTLSNAQNLEGMVITTIFWPAAWTAADLQFQASVDGTNYFPVFDDAASRVKVASASLPTGAAEVIVNKTVLEQLAGLTWLKLESSVAQGAPRTITLLLKG